MSIKQAIKEETERALPVFKAKENILKCIVQSELCGSLDTKEKIKYLKDIVNQLKHVQNLTKALEEVRDG